MTAHACSTCHAAIPPGLAVVRTVTFRPVAWCRPCWELRLAVNAVFPEQRRAGERVEA